MTMKPTLRDDGPFGAYAAKWDREQIEKRAIASMVIIGDDTPARIRTICGKRDTASAMWSSRASGPPSAARSPAARPSGQRRWAGIVICTRCRRIISK